MRTVLAVFFCMNLFYLVAPLFSSSICSKRKLEWDFLLAGCLFVAQRTVADHWREFKVLTSSRKMIDWISSSLIHSLTCPGRDMAEFNSFGHQCPLCIVRIRCSFLPSKVKYHFVWRWATHLLKRSGMARVNEGSQFYLPPIHLSTSGMNRTCLYSPAAEHHCTLAGILFPSCWG